MNTNRRKFIMIALAVVILGGTGLFMLKQQGEYNILSDIDSNAVKIVVEHQQSYEYRVIFTVDRTNFKDTYTITIGNGGVYGQPVTELDWGFFYTFRESDWLNDVWVFQEDFAVKYVQDYIARLRLAFTHVTTGESFTDTYIVSFTTVEGKEGTRPVTTTTEDTGVIINGGDITTPSGRQTPFGIEFLPFAVIILVYLKRRKIDEK